MKNKPLLVALVLWLSAGFIGHEINAKRNQRIYLSKPIPCYSSEAGLLKDAETEKRKLGLENITIEFVESPNIEGGHSIKAENKFKITFNPRHKNRLVLRHELYHIKTWSNTSLIDFLTMGSYNEYNATSYSIMD